MPTQPSFERDLLLETFGGANTNRVVERFFRFAYTPQSVLERLASEALSENWGAGLYVLKKYLAIYVPWAVEQGHFTHSENQLYICAGSLQTRYGTPLYLAFEPNQNQGQQPWCLTFAGSNLSAPELPSPPDIPEPPTLPKGVEIVMMDEHIINDRLQDRLSFLQQTPPVAQLCSISGAIQWSLNRELQLSYWYYGKMQYVVPLYLQSRENITQAPDAIAPIEVHDNRLVVRTVLPPHAPYPNARVAVHRHDQLPAWLLDCWNNEAASTSDSDIDDPESRARRPVTAQGGQL